MALREIKISLTLQVQRAPNKALQLPANPLLGLSAAVLTLTPKSKMLSFFPE